MKIRTLSPILNNVKEKDVKVVLPRCQAQTSCMRLRDDISKCNSPSRQAAIDQTRDLELGYTVMKVGQVILV